MRSPRIAVLAIFAIVAIEFFAISHGINGVALTGSVGAIAAVGGYFFGRGKGAKV